MTGNTLLPNHVLTNDDVIAGNFWSLKQLAATYTNSFSMTVQLRSNILKELFGYTEKQLQKVNTIKLK